MPSALKSGIENLSGYSLDDVKVHYNSNKPAQLNANAFAQGTDIHLGPGQERHLPHEAWHVVQQKQGRVRATRQMKATLVNDDPGLEREADIMGERALSGPLQSSQDGDLKNNTTHPILQANFTYTASVVLDRKGAEKKTPNEVRVESIELPETERPPSQYGEKQQAHSVSWTLLKQAYSRFKPGPLMKLLDYLEHDWTALRKQKDLNKMGAAHSNFNDFLARYDESYFEALKNASASLLAWYGKVQQLITDYFVALQLSALATHTGYVMKIGESGKIKESQPSGHGEPTANAYFQNLEHQLEQKNVPFPALMNKEVLAHAKYYWDPGIGMVAGINESEHVDLILDKYETAFERAFPLVWKNYKDEIQKGLSEEAREEVKKFTGQGHSSVVETSVDGDEKNLEEGNTGGFQASVRLEEDFKPGGGTASQYHIAEYEIVAITLPNDRPVTKYGIIGQKSHTVSWTLVIKSLRNLGTKKTLSDFLQSLLMLWINLERQNWNEMLDTNLISGTDLQRRDILNTQENVIRYNQQNKARLTELKNKIPQHIADLHAMVKGQSFTDVEWAKKVQKAVADYVVTYQSSPLATYKAEPTPRGHGEPDANEWLGKMESGQASAPERRAKYFKDTFKGKTVNKTNFKGNDQTDWHMVGELAKVPSHTDLQDADQMTLDKLLVKHLALKYLDANWKTVGSDLETSPGEFAQLLVEWEESMAEAYPQVWAQHSSVLKAYSENVMLSDGLKKQRAESLKVPGNDPKNLHPDDAKLKPWVEEERAKRADLKGVISIQAGNEHDDPNEHPAYNNAKAEYRAGRDVARMNPDSKPSDDDPRNAKMGHGDYLEGMQDASNDPGFTVPGGDRNLAYKQGFEDHQQGYQMAHGDILLKGGEPEATKRGHAMYMAHVVEGHALARNGGFLTPNSRPGVIKGFNQHHYDSGYTAAHDNQPLVGNEHDEFRKGHAQYGEDVDTGYFNMVNNASMAGLYRKGHIRGRQEYFEQYDQGRDDQRSKLDKQSTAPAYVKGYDDAKNSINQKRTHSEAYH